MIDAISSVATDWYLEEINGQGQCGVRSRPLQVSICSLKEGTAGTWLVAS
jgi:hypothetical protein